MAQKLSFKPKVVVQKMLKTLPVRARTVIEKRYGLGKDTAITTLEAIGKEYGITRERVRQVENYALASIRKSSAFTEAEVYFSELEDIVRKMGGIIREDELLSELAKDKSTRNFLHLLLVLGNAFIKEKSLLIFITDGT